MPTSHYSVLQYAPDVATGERVNVGLMVFSAGHRPLVKVIQSWDRVRPFAGRDLATVKKFLAVVESGDGPIQTPEDARRAAGAWQYAIQFTEPQPSLLSPKKLLADLAPRFLRDESPRALQKPPYRTRTQAVRDAVRTIRKAVVAAGFRKVIRTPVPHSGRRGQHQFDVGALNGKVYFLGQAVSFEQPDEEKVSMDLDAASWRFKDIRDVDSDLKLALFAFVPHRPAPLPLVAQAERNFGDLDVQIVTEAQLPEWSHELAEEIAAEAG
jgi:Protein of unknown function (DUF3037)